VITGSQQIDVLGTAFNIKAYKNEKEITSTLVEGKIRLLIDEKTKTLKPSEQLVYHTDEQRISIQKIDKPFDVIAWKEGYFSFKQKSMKEIMETLSRWYDMDYLFKNPEKEKKRFSGVLDRESNMGKILKYIEMTNEIKFTIYENTVTIE
jgi:ferric-dicitrate binding protein FerR (iron transport regulator)